MCYSPLLDRVTCIGNGKGQGIMDVVRHIEDIEGAQVTDLNGGWKGI